MGLYIGLDVHSSSSLVGVVDEGGRRLMTKKVHNDPRLVVEVVKSLPGEIVGVVVESTYNWYWVVDAVMDAGYRVHLANPSQIKQYEGLKHADDRHDATDHWPSCPASTRPTWQYSPQSRHRRS